MNLLYISKLTGNLFAGPNNSVPAQIKAQSEIDAVFWYNLNKVKRDEWEAIGCHNLNDYPTERLSDLPEPFCSPDLVVVEELYCFPFCKILRDIQKKRVPYIIIPRSEMTLQAQKKKACKKILGNAIYFNQVISKAAAIQYLSEQERAESEAHWEKRSFVIPNGTKIKEFSKKRHDPQSIKGVYIGRFEKQQKGLDILVEAIEKQQALLRQNNFHLEMYGVDQEGTLEYLNHFIANAGITDLISIKDAVYGEEKERALQEADVFVMTSRFEGMPMGLIEALAYKLPALVTEGTNMAKEIAEMNAGWTSDNTVSGVAGIFQRMLEEKAFLYTMGENAYSLASKYSWESIAVRSHTVYEALINE